MKFKLDKKPIIFNSLFFRFIYSFFENIKHILIELQYVFTFFIQFKTAFYLKFDFIIKTDKKTFTFKSLMILLKNPWQPCI